MGLYLRLRKSSSYEGGRYRYKNDIKLQDHQGNMCHPVPRVGSTSFEPDYTKLFQPLIHSVWVGTPWHDCSLSTPSLSNEPNLLSTLSSCETSHLSLSDSFSQMGTTPPYSPNGEITGRNRWDETRSSAEIWTYSPQETEKGRMTLCLCAEIFS